VPLILVRMLQEHLRDRIRVDPNEGRYIERAK
jgi:hypothetical protein